MTTSTLITTAANLMAASDTSALQAEARFGALAPTIDEIKALWLEARDETKKKREQRAKSAVSRWDAAASYNAELAELASQYRGGMVDESAFDSKLAFLAATTGVVLDSALTLASWLEAIAEKGAASANGQATESVAKLTGQKKAAKRAARQPKATTATTAKGKQSNGAAPEPAAAHAGAIRDADSATADLVAATDGLLSDVETLIRATVEQAMGAPDVATAVAIMAKAWAKAAGVVDSQPLAKVA